MNDIQTHFEMLLSPEEQERIGATPDKSDSIRVMRLLGEYSELVFTNERAQLTIDMQKKLIKSMTDNACQRESARMRAETIVEQLKLVLKEIVSYDEERHDGICPYGCDTPNIAKQALDKLAERTANQS